MTPHYLTHTHLGPQSDTMECTRCGNPFPADTLWLPNYTCDACDRAERVEQIKAERAAELIKTLRAIGLTPANAYAIAKLNK